MHLMQPSCHVRVAYHAPRCLILPFFSLQPATMRLLLSPPSLRRRGLATVRPTPPSPILHELPAAPGPDPAYDTHMATTPFQKAFIAGFAAVAAVRDPERGDMVAALGETTGAWACARPD